MSPKKEIPTEEFDPRGPSPDGALLTPIDPIDAIFKEAQAAILRGDDQVDVTPECVEFAGALQAAICLGPAADAEVHQLARANRGLVPPLIDPDGASDGVPDDGPLGEVDTGRLRRMSRATLLRLVERLLRDHAGPRGSDGDVPERLGSLSDDELRATARDLLPDEDQVSTTTRR